MNWIEKVTVVAIAVGCSIGSALAQDKTADFIQGVYARDGRCDKVQAIEAGAPKTADTVTDTLTSAGFQAWAGNCVFEDITEKEKGRSYQARVKCTEGTKSWVEKDDFLLDPSGNLITVWTDGEKSQYVKCESGKGK